MQQNELSSAEQFLAGYPEAVHQLALATRQLLLQNLPKVIEQIDIPAKMIAYCYGQKYAELVCTIIPSQKGVKLGFNRGIDLPDPHRLLKGTGKISRYIEIKSEEQINSIEMAEMIAVAYQAYKELMNVAKK